MAYCFNIYYIWEYFGVYKEYFSVNWVHFELCCEYFTVNGEFFEIYWGAFADTAFESFLCILGVLWGILWVLCGMFGVLLSILGVLWIILDMFEIQWGLLGKIWHVLHVFASILLNISSTFGNFGVLLVILGVL